MIPQNMPSQDTGVVMKRRKFISNSIGSALTAGFTASQVSSAHAGLFGDTPVELNYLNAKSKSKPFVSEPGPKPHIFLITADMISPDSYLPSRDISRHVNLKNIRSIGDYGSRFDNAVTTIPLCGPARASLFTGKYPPYLTNGERAPLGMKTDLAEDDTIFQEYLLHAGYSTKHVGKCHVGADKFLMAFGEHDDAWNRWAPPLLEDDDYAQFLRDKNVQAPKYRSELRGKQVDRQSPGNSLGGWIEQADGSDFPLEAHYSVYLAEKAISKIETALTTQPDAPLYLELDFFDPHQPFSIPTSFENRARELRKQVKLPESYKSLMDRDFSFTEGTADIYEVYRKYWGAYDPELVKEYIVCHFLQMEIVDYAVGIVLDAIRRKGIWDDSLIMFTGDHGEINGRLGLFDKGVYFQPDIFRIPLFMKAPAENGGGSKVVKEPVSCLDISRTILSAAGIQTTEHYDGEDLMPVLNGKGKRTPLVHIFQTGWHVGVNYGFGLNLYENEQHHWFYGYNISSGVQELYNMSEDSQKNLFYDRQYAGTVKKIILKAAEILQSDRRWLGYWATFRLHNAEILPTAKDDMQMFVPKKSN